MNEFADAKQIALLGIALAVGLLIGVERGWTTREAKEGERIAGLRTYGLISLLGACAGLLAQHEPRNGRRTVGALCASFAYETSRHAYSLGGKRVLSGGLFPAPNAGGLHG